MARRIRPPPPGSQILAGAATLAFGLATGSLMQDVAFDYLWWVLTIYCFTRLRRGNDPRWWVPIGLSIGLGMLTKYSMLFCVAGLGGAFLVSGRWRDLRTSWLWAGVGLSIVVFLPNLLWQVSHHFVSLYFLRHIHERDIRIGRTRSFLPDQLEMTLFALPLALAGLWFLLFSRSGRRWRALGSFYVIPLILFLIAQGRGYYLAPAYPLLYAAGCAWIASAIAQRSLIWRQAIWTVLALAVALNIFMVAAFVIPLAPVGSAWWQHALKTNGDLAEEFGWPELVAKMAQVWNSLDPAERRQAAIFAANHGEAGAINLYGPALGLPPAISEINSFWERGYGDPPPTTVVTVGFSQKFVEAHFGSFQPMGKVTNREGVTNEETTSAGNIFICRHLKEPWPAFWKQIRHYG